MDKTINLVKLCVGADGVEDLIDWQESPRARGPDGQPRHITRMWPKRSDALLNGGSLYWVFKGFILARQRIIRLDEVQGDDGVRRCALVLDPDVHRTEAVPRRPFQGWRYLKPDESPRDLTSSRQHEDALPAELTAALADIGVR